MITPGPYESYGKGARLIIAGSNQETFEVSLNSSYTFCRRHAQPIIDSEVSDMCKLNNVASSLDDLKFYCNNVPREVLGFSRAESPEVYLRLKHQLMFEDVSQKLSQLDEGKKKSVSAILENLFFDHNLAILGNTIPFFDIGLVYRTRVDSDMRVFPLCLPAEMALVTLWKMVGPTHTKTVQECIDTSDGLGLEKLVLSKFLSDHVGANVPLPTFRLGDPKLQDQVSVPIDVVNVATCTSLEVIQDVARVKRLAEKRNLTILYVFPKGTKAMDLCIISKTGVIPIQVSLSSLTVHDKPDNNFLKDIGVYTREITTRNYADWKYVFITTAPELHNDIAQQMMWNGLETDKIRIVDATTWLHRDNV